MEELLIKVNEWLHEHAIIDEIWGPCDRAPEDHKGNICGAGAHVYDIKDILVAAGVQELLEERDRYLSMWMIEKALNDR